MDDALVEHLDGIEVEYYKGRFLAGSGHILDKPWAMQNAKVGKLPIFIVAASVTWAPKLDKNGDLFKLVNFHAEEVVPLSGEMRRQAKIFLSQEGEDGVIDFGSDGEGQRLRLAVLEHERLEEYLRQEWAGEEREGESLADRAIRLLEELRSYSPPATDHWHEDSDEDEIAGPGAGDDRYGDGFGDGPVADHDIPDEDPPPKQAPPPGPDEPQPDFSVPDDDDRSLSPVPNKPAAVPSGPIFDIPPDSHDGATFSRPMAVAG